ncbi:unnamed protein product [Oppiella nova]|uniref:UDP-glycosyltransferase n=1 Tax=Oppiella nova TaxID=334625 RepID=A0A7R9QRT5_9ACAR|nr:unnamed protein product [Oppiella nova]CAG2172653.1 unnamed protein product [Oppiella nova]
MTSSMVTTRANGAAYWLRLSPTPEGLGHINACIGIAQVLQEAGHRVVFAVKEHWKGKFASYGIEEVEMGGDLDELKPAVGDPVKFMAERIREAGFLSDIQPLEKLQKRMQFQNRIVDMYIKLDKTIEPVIPSVKPDVIFVDQYLSLPSIETSGIPYVWVWTANPLFMFDDDRAPPYYSGDKSEWKAFRETRDKGVYDIWKTYNDYVISRGCQPLKQLLFKNQTKCLNIYGFPQEMDYTDDRPLPKNFIRFDNLKRNEKLLAFEIPVPLRDRPGKLIYFSMGSMGGVDLDLMKRLVTILSKSKHRFIVSKGPLHEEYDLPVNMWGAATVPQIQLI